MYTYIKQSISKHFVTFEEPLSSEEYNNIGENWQDYLDNKWVLLTEEQVVFHEEHPLASVLEVWNMEITLPHMRTLEDAKRQKIMEIDYYDSSDAVNEFSYDGVSMWLDKATRDGLYLRFLSEQAMGKTTTTLWFDTISFSIPMEQAFQMLYAIEVYASGCYDRTAAHKAAVAELDTVAAVDGYDYTTGYPEKLAFNS